MRDNRPTGASHIPALIKAVQSTAGPILELGMGPFSTALLHTLAKDMGRELHSFENNPGYFKKYSNFAREHHLVTFVSDWDKALIERLWGLAFVDHSPDDRRVIEIKRLAKYARCIVAHDSDRWPYKDLYPLFKRHEEYTKIKPYTLTLWT